MLTRELPIELIEIILLKLKLDPCVKEIPIEFSYHIKRKINAKPLDNGLICYIKPRVINLERCDYCGRFDFCRKFGTSVLLDKPSLLTNDGLAKINKIKLCTGHCVYPYSPFCLKSKKGKHIGGILTYLREDIYNRYKAIYCYDIQFYYLLKKNILSIYKYCDSELYYKSYDWLKEARQKQESNNYYFKTPFVKKCMNF